MNRAKQAVQTVSLGHSTLNETTHAGDIRLFLKPDIQCTMQEKHDKMKVRHGDQSQPRTFYEAVFYIPKPFWLPTDMRHCRR